MASWPSGCPALLRGGLQLRPPDSYLSPTPLPLPLPPLLSLMPRPLDPWIFWACCVGAGVWPLGGLPPGRKFPIRAKIDLACSSGAPLPPNGGGAPSPTLSACQSAPLSFSSHSLRLVVGGGLRWSWGLPPISCIRPRTKGVRACSWSVPPSPSWCLPYLPLLILNAGRWERTLLEGCPLLGALV